MRRERERERENTKKPIPYASVLCSEKSRMNKVASSFRFQAQEFGMNQSLKHHPKTPVISRSWIIVLFVTNFCGVRKSPVFTNAVECSLIRLSSEVSKSSFASLRELARKVMGSQEPTEKFEESLVFRKSPICRRHHRHSLSASRFSSSGFHRSSSSRSLRAAVGAPSCVGRAPEALSDG